jgi:lipopolysaccharide export system protein LptA
MKTLYVILLILLFSKAISSNENESIEIIAETMEWNKQEGKAIAIGNAQAVKGATIIKADKIVAVMAKTDNNKIEKLLANGNIKFSKNDQLASGNKAVYYLEQDKIIIKGNVSLERDGNIIKGEKLVIDFLTGLSKMDSSNSNQKVKMKYSTE